MTALKVTVQSDDIFGDIAHTKKYVDEELNAFYDAKIKQAILLGTQHKELVSALKKCHQAGGKRLRSYLLLLIWDENVAKSKDARQIATALDLLHTHFLIHDDVIDHDTRRHNAPNISGIYERKLRRSASDQASSLASSIAILAGDLALSYVYELVNMTNLHEGQKAQCIDTMSAMMSEVIAGQTLDVLNQMSKRQNDRDIIKLYRTKTASYSTVGPLQLGALLARASQKTFELLGEYGSHIGIAYQIRDDCLAFEVSAKELGKSPLTDIWEGKQTLLYYYANQFASVLQRQTLKKSYGNPQATIADWRAVKQVMVQSGAFAKVTSIAQDHIQKAQTIAQKLDLDNHIKDRLHEFAQLCINRTK